MSAEHRGSGHDGRAQAHDHPHDHPHDHGHDDGHDDGHGHDDDRVREHNHEAHARRAGNGAHRHGGGHSHGHAHGHGITDERRLTTALTITLAFALVEIGGGWLSGSLALLADAGHMFADAGALALALFALRAARRPADSTFSYGHRRYEVLAAFVNGLLLIGLSLWILAEAIQRLIAPEAVQGQAMFVTAVLGLAANLASFMVLREGEQNLNVRAAVMHVVGDVLGSVATIAAAAVILWSHWLPVDPLLSALVAVLILRGAWAVTRQSAHVLLEGAPLGFDVNGVAMDLTAAVPAVHSVHHVHVWSLTGEEPMVTLHAVLREGADREGSLRAIQRRLRERFGVGHATVQIESSACSDDEHGTALCGADGPQRHAHR